MHCVDFFLSGSFEDRGICHVIQLSYDWVPIKDRYINSWKKCPYLHNHHSKKKINTVFNLITLIGGHFQLSILENFMNLFSKTLYILNFQKKNAR